MLKMPITYQTYDDPPRTETKNFYFNFTKLELIEMIGVDDLETQVKLLNETEDRKEAYAIFKKILLAGYGVRTEEGGFRKKDPTTGAPLSRIFEEHPACSAFIMDFIEHPKKGAKFIEGCLPAEAVAAAKAEIAQQRGLKPEEITSLVEEAAVLQDDPETAIQPGTAPEGVTDEEVDEAAMIAALQDEPVEEKPKKFNDFSDKELLEMPQAQFEELVGTRDPKRMNKRQLTLAFQRKTAG